MHCNGSVVKFNTIKVSYCLFAEPVDTIEVVNLVETAGAGPVGAPDILSHDGGGSLSQDIQHMNGHTSVLVVGDILEDGGEGVTDVVGQELGEGTDDTGASGGIGLRGDHGVTAVGSDHVVQVGQVLLIDELDKSAVQLEDNLEGLLFLASGRWAVLFLGTFKDGLANGNSFLLEGVKVISGQDEDILGVSLVLDGDLDFLLKLVLGISSFGCASTTKRLPVMTTTVVAAGLLGAAAFAGA